MFGLFKRKKRPKGNGSEKIDINIELQQIPGGSFLMGSYFGEDNERPIHNVIIDEFFMSKFLVTQKNWFDLMQSKPWKGLEFVKEGDQYPAVNISWYDAKDFIKKLNKLTGKKYRLPTEAEWEYSCVAGENLKKQFWLYKLVLRKYAWYYSNAFKKGERYAHEICKKKPNNWGLHDMIGNVYEWCSDWYRRNFYIKSSVNNPHGPLYGKYRSVRGGDWSRTSYFLRPSARRYYSPHYKDSCIGFRLALDISGENVEGKSELSE